MKSACCFMPEKLKKGRLTWDHLLVSLLMPQVLCSGKLASPSLLIGSICSNGMETERSTKRTLYLYDTATTQLQGAPGEDKATTPKWLMRKLRIRAVELHTQKPQAKSNCLEGRSLPAGLFFQEMEMDGRTKVASGLWVSPCGKVSSLPTNFFLFLWKVSHSLSRSIHKQWWF